MVRRSCIRKEKQGNEFVDVQFKNGLLHPSVTRACVSEYSYAANLRLYDVSAFAIVLISCDQTSNCGICSLANGMSYFLTLLEPIRLCDFSNCT